MHHGYTELESLFRGGVYSLKLGGQEFAVDHRKAELSATYFGGFHGVERETSEH